MKYLIPLAVVIASVVFVQHYRHVLGRLSEAEAQIEGYKEAAKIHADYLDKLRQKNTEWDDLSNELMTMDGKDAPLPDYLRAAAGRVWP